MIKKIIFCTLRQKRGATGGPGGVLYLQMQTLGNSINGIPCEYHFNKLTMRLGPLRTPLNLAIFKLIFMMEKDVYFFTHDIEMAAFLARHKKKYSLIFHQQGPIVLEAKNMGKKWSKAKIQRMKNIERDAFINANTLHFPSKGAADMYFDSEFANCKRNEVNLVDPLYNIIPLVTPSKPDNLDLVRNDRFLTLFSLGTLTEAKGQDKTVAFIREFTKVSQKPLRYIMVGKGPLKDFLINSLDEIKKECPTFEYHFFESMPHDSVMYLHMISDIYIMLHRISIFDFATLEAMSQKSAVILSKVGGNKDFDIENNIIFAEDALANMNILNNNEIDDLKKLNYKVFCQHFSKDAFIKQYENFFNIYLK